MRDGNLPSQPMYEREREREVIDFKIIFLKSLFDRLRALNKITDLVLKRRLKLLPWN